MRQAAAAVSVGTYCYVAVCKARSARRREALQRPEREERGRGIVAAHLQLVLY